MSSPKQHQPTSHLIRNELVSTEELHTDQNGGEGMKEDVVEETVDDESTKTASSEFIKSSNQGANLDINSNFPTIATPKGQRRKRKHLYQNNIPSQIPTSKEDLNGYNNDDDNNTNDHQHSLLQKQKSLNNLNEQQQSREDDVQNNDELHVEQSPTISTPTKTTPKSNTKKITPKFRQRRLRKHGIIPQYPKPSVDSNGEGNNAASGTHPVEAMSGRRSAGTSKRKKKSTTYTSEEDSGGGTPSKKQKHIDRISNGAFASQLPFIQQQLQQLQSLQFANIPTILAPEQLPGMRQFIQFYQAFQQQPLPNNENQLNNNNPNINASHDHTVNNSNSITATTTTSSSSIASSSDSNNTSGVEPTASVELAFTKAVTDTSIGNAQNEGNSSNVINNNSNGDMDPSSINNTDEQAFCNETQQQQQQ